jgi:hypothetical protein
LKGRRGKGTVRLVEEQRKPGPLLGLLSYPEEKVCFRTGQYAHLARQILSFEGTTTKREKRQDWMAVNPVARELLSRLKIPC